MPTGLIVPDFFLHTSVPSVELCLEDTVANTKGKSKKGGPKEGGNAMSSLHSQGFPARDTGSKIRSGSEERGTKSEVAASPLPSRGPKRGQNCYATPAFSGIPNKGEQNHKCMAASPLPSRGPKRGRKCYVTPTFSWIPNAKRGEQNLKWLSHLCLLTGPKEGGNAMSPLHSRASPTPSAGGKIRSGPQQRGTKSEVAASPLPSRGPKRGRKCIVTLAFSGITNAKCGKQKQKRSPTKGKEIRSGPQQWGTKSQVAASPLPSRGPKRGRKCYVTPAFSGSPTPSMGSKIKSGCLTPAFSRAQKRAEMQRHPCILGDTQSQGQEAKSEVVPNKGEQNQKWPPHPCLLTGPKEGGNATSPLHSRGSPKPRAGSKIRSGPQQRGTKSEKAASPLPSHGPKRGWKCYATPVFSGVPLEKSPSRGS